MQLCCKLEYSVAQTCHLYTHLCGCFPVSQAWKALTPYLHQLEPSLFFNAQLKFHLLQSLSLSPGRTSSLLKDSWVFIQASTYDAYRFFLQVNYLGQCFMPPTIFHARYPSDLPKIPIWLSLPCFKSFSGFQLPIGSKLSLIAWLLPLLPQHGLMPAPPKIHALSHSSYNFAEAAPPYGTFFPPFHMVNTNSSFKTQFKYPFFYKDFPEYSLHPALLQEEPSSGSIFSHSAPSRLLLYHLSYVVHLSAYLSDPPIKLLSSWSSGSISYLQNLARDLSPSRNSVHACRVNGWKSDDWVNTEKNKWANERVYAYINAGMIKWKSEWMSYAGISE